VTDLVEAAPDCLLFDTDEKLTRADLLLLLAAGFRGGLRYVGYEDQPFPGDLDAAELDDMLTLGLGAMVVQHCRRPPWATSAAVGDSDGRNGCRHAQAAGYKAGATFWDDLEGIGLGSTNLSTAAYANAKRDAVIATYPLGEYIGDDVPMSGHDLFALLVANRYWKSLSQVPDIAERGYCMVQLGTVKVGRLTVDVNWHTADRLGGRAMWMRRSA
jgi:hypothetical protein